MNHFALRLIPTKHHGAGKPAKSSKFPNINFHNCSHPHRETLPANTSFFLQKAAKQLASRNSSTLNRTHLITLLLHTTFLLLRAILFRRTFTRSSLLLYILLASPGALIEIWFEKIARPTTASGSGGAGGGGGGGRSGEDLDAKGLTEYLWDVLYWTWLCLGLAALVGDYAWLMWGAVPLYSVWLAWSTWKGVSRGGGLMGAMGEGGEGAGESKRQKKMEKRGGQRVQYR